MKRTFLAVKIIPGDRFSDTFNEIKSALQHEKIKWVETHNMHITLKFFGDTSDSEIDTIEKIVAPIARETPSFHVKVEGTGFFGKSRQPRVLWFGINDGSRLKNVGNHVLNALEKAGFEKERNEFNPHLTLGRIKFIKDIELFREVIEDFRNEEIQESEISEIILFESILHPGGPEYNPLRKFRLEGK